MYLNLRQAGMTGKAGALQREGAEFRGRSPIGNVALGRRCWRRRQYDDGSRPSDSEQALGDLSAQGPRRLDLLIGDRGGHLEALPDARFEIDVMGLDEGKQRRLDLEALDDAERVAPVVDIVSRDDLSLGLRQRAADPREHLPEGGVLAHLGARE